MRALIAIDGSRPANTAMNAACRILSPEDREVDLICVVPSRRAANGMSEKMQKRAQRILERSRAALAQQGISVRPCIEKGSPVGTLLRASLRYDVTVVGGHSRNDSSLGGLGPVASRIVEHSSTSVLIGRETRNDSGLRILVPVDGSDVALAAIDKLASLVNLSTADVTLLHVVEAPWLGFEEETPGEEEEFDAQAHMTHGLELELEREANDVIEQARARLPVRATVSSVIQRGLPAEAILGEADSGDYDLVLMAASGSTDLKHQLLGSVSIKVAWNAPCSVLLVRQDDAT